MNDKTNDKFKENQFKPGQSGNPLGNALDRHSTKRFSTIINEILDNEDIEFEDLKKQAKTGKAREALSYALLKKANGGDVKALQLLFEWSDGKLPDTVNHSFETLAERMAGKDAEPHS